MDSEIKKAVETIQKAMADCTVMKKAIDKMNQSELEKLADELGHQLDGETYQETADRLRSIGATKNADMWEIMERRWFEADACAAGGCKHCGNAACTFHHPICAEALYEHEQARRHGIPPSGRHG